MTSAFGPIDYILVALYLAVVIGIGLALSGKQESAEKYFLANRRMPRWVVGFTLMATLISSNALIAHPAIVYQKGMILVPGFLMMPVVLLLVARYIVPFYRRTVKMSAYEFIGARFGLAGRMYTSFGFLMSRTLGIGTTLLTTSIALNVMTGWPIELTIVCIMLSTSIYTLCGGITAVVYTDVIQGIILMVGGLLILVRLLFAPEFQAPFAVVGAAWDAGKFSLGSTEFSMQSLYDVDERTIWLFVVAMSIQWGRRYICDQAMVQRYLIAESTRSASKGTLLGVALSVPVIIAFNVIGALLYGFYHLTGAVAPAVGDHIMPHFIVNYIPTGFTGVILAAILAASMSSISSDLNSIATVLTRDYFQLLLPGLSDLGQRTIGRIMVIVAGSFAAYVAVLLIPTENTVPLAERALVITVILSAGTLGVFMLGFLTRRATASGCYTGIIACLIFTGWGVLTEPTNRLLDLGQFNFGMNPILIGVFGHIIAFGVGYMASLLLGGRSAAELQSLTLFQSAKSEDQRA